MQRGTFYPEEHQSHGLNSPPPIQLHHLQGRPPSCCPGELMHSAHGQETSCKEVHTRGATCTFYPEEHQSHGSNSPPRSSCTTSRGGPACCCPWSPPWRAFQLCLLPALPIRMIPGRVTHVGPPASLQHHFLLFHLSREHVPRTPPLCKIGGGKSLGSSFSAIALQACHSTATSELHPLKWREGCKAGTIFIFLQCI